MEKEENAAQYRERREARHADHGEMHSEEPKEQARKKPETLRSESSDEGWDESLGIDTTYLTEERKTDPADRGFVCLLLSIMLSAFLVGFGGLYTVMLMTGKTSALEEMGKQIPGPAFGIWTGFVIAGLVFNMIGVGTKTAVVSLLAFIAYTAAAVLVCVLLGLHPFYIGLTAGQALLCLIAGIRKGSGKH